MAGWDVRFEYAYDTWAERFAPDIEADFSLRIIVLQDLMEWVNEAPDEDDIIHLGGLIYKGWLTYSGQEVRFGLDRSFDPPRCYVAEIKPLS